MLSIGRGLIDTVRFAKLHRLQLRHHQYDGKQEQQTLKVAQGLIRGFVYCCSANISIAFSSQALSFKTALRGPYKRTT